MARKYSRKRKVLIVTLSILALLIAVRLALPYVVFHYANKTLDEMDGYRGHIKDIDLAIIRGAYKIDSIYLNKVDSATKKETPFLAASLVDPSIEWRVQRSIFALHAIFLTAHDAPCTAQLIVHYCIAKKQAFKDHAERQAAHSSVLDKKIYQGKIQF